VQTFGSTNAGHHTHASVIKKHLHVVCMSASEGRWWAEALQHYQDTLALAPHHAQVSEHGNLCSCWLVQGCCSSGVISGDAELAFNFVNPQHLTAQCELVTCVVLAAAATAAAAAGAVQFRCGVPGAGAA
jgi:hypothetical protein